MWRVRVKSLPQVCAILAVTLWFLLHQPLTAHELMYSGIIQTVLIATEHIVLSQIEWSIYLYMLVNCLFVCAILMVNSASCLWMLEASWPEINSRSSSNAQKPEITVDICSCCPQSKENQLPKTKRLPSLIYRAVFVSSFCSKEQHFVF